MKYSIHIVIFLVFAVLAACTEQSRAPEYRPSFQAQPPTTQKKEYLFGIHPLHNPQRMFEIYGPLVDQLSWEIPEVKFSMEASRNYKDFSQKIAARKLHFILPNPYQTIRAIDQGYRVFAKMSDDENFHGIILVRKDSGIKTIMDLKGKKVSFPAATALAASMMPQYYMQTHGLNVKTDIEARYVGSQESAILSAYNKEVAAGATWLPPWKSLSRERPELASAMRILVETDSLLNNSLMAREDIDPLVTEKVKNVLLHFHENEKGRAVLRKLELSKFEDATNETYKPALNFLKKYTALLGAVE